MSIDKTHWTEPVDYPNVKIARYERALRRIRDEFRPCIDYGKCSHDVCLELGSVVELATRVLAGEDSKDIAL